jgi:uncharacterized protein (DUF1330 family)
MKIRSAVALSILAGVGMGAGIVQGLHAQAKLPAYVVTEIDVMNQEGYNKEFAPAAAKALQDAGGKYLARGGKNAAIEGEPPKSRVSVIAFESIDKAQAAFASPALKQARIIGDKYAKFRIFVVEGVGQ